MKEVSWKFAFRYFFPLGRGLTTGRWPPTHVPPSKGSTFLHRTVGLPRCGGKDSEVARTPWPHQWDEALWPARSSATRFQLLRTNTWLRMTVTLHSTKEKAGFVLSWVFSPLSLEHCPKKYLCLFYYLSVCPLCLNVDPSQANLQTCDAGHFE